MPSIAVPPAFVPVKIGVFAILFLKKLVLNLCGFKPAFLESL